MKNDKLIYSIGSVIIIIGALMKILHLPYANTVLISDFIVIFFSLTEPHANFDKRILQ